MARKGTIKNMGKVQREMSAAWKARKHAKAAATPDDKTPPTREEASRFAERAAFGVAPRVVPQQLTDGGDAEVLLQGGRGLRPGGP
ncbi:MAG TPA: hypothetical protein PLU35_13290 [Phycisphaerales bacterium]|nr:hypothetical protein [Phycisphaerales bacterium]